MNAPALQLRSAPVEPLWAEVKRPLVEADIVALAQNRGTEAPSLKRLSQRHHRAAQMIADGVAPGVVASVLGYSLSRVSILQADTSFAELVKHYSEHKAAIYGEMHEHLAGLGVEAVLELRERLEDEPEKLSPMQILELAKFASDRAGHGPQTQSTQTHIHLNVADRLKAARERSAQQTPQIEGTVNKE